MLVSEAFESYRIEHIVYLNQSARTEEMHRCAQKRLIDFTGDIEIENLTFDLVRKWKVYLEKEMSQNSTRGYIIKLRVVLKHLALKGYSNILNYEMVGVPKRHNTVVDFITPEDVERILTIISTPDTHNRLSLRRHRNRAIVSLLYASGIRVGELCSLRITDMKMDTMTFTVVGKGNKPRLCFFDERSRDYIREYLRKRKDQSPALFVHETSADTVNRGTVEMIFRNITIEAGFDHPIHPHTMRHSFATNLLRNNTNLLYVRDFLGHTSVQTTEMYTHVVNEDLRSIYAEKHTI